MKDLGITPGEWQSYIIDLDDLDIAAISTSSKVIAQCVFGGKITDEIKANAKLIADAGNTAQECGLLPSELLAQRDELISVINSFIRDFEGDYVMRDGSIVDNPNILLLTNYKLLKNTIKKVTE